MKRARLLFYRARKLPGKFTGASRNALSGPVKFPDNGPDKLTGPEVTGTFEKRAPDLDFGQTRLKLLTFLKTSVNFKSWTRVNPCWLSKTQPYVVAFAINCH